LALEDGTLFRGWSRGSQEQRTGEVVFNTSLMGYQEILTDPSYAGQIVTMTYPHIGNYGVSEDDAESADPAVAGFVVRELTDVPSNFRASSSLEAYLGRWNIPCIEGIDTRALTLKLRITGAMRGVITSSVDDPAEAVRFARESPTMLGADWVREVAPKEPYDWDAGLDSTYVRLRSDSQRELLVVAIDCGMKRNILRHLVDLGCRVRVVPPFAKPEEVLDQNPDGLFISNGPGDPAVVGYAIDLLKGVVGKVPVFGICLGHQLLALSLGAESFKLKFGHHGGNHPVRNMHTGRVEITSQNHGFAIDTGSLERAGGTTTHVNLNDQTLEGFSHRELPLFAVQYHPEAAPGPHDAAYLFDCFTSMMTTGRPPSGEEMEAAQAALQARG
jgi:carbamoyl-phosphate synthase small subunit